MNAIGGLFPFILNRVCAITTPPSAEHFRRAREAQFGKSWEELLPSEGAQRQEEWAKARAGYDVLDGLLQESGGPYVMGDTLSFADVTIGSFLLAFKRLLGEESPEWQDLRKWNEGRWVQRLQAAERYLGGN
ncbi:hypothetical protein HGRIS_006245 [Hohenbuehelia grisea]|uniref:Glutathione S-transferase UstS-like C-terminal domain-containing protein n=1 Tax=Hohenbuehelia grisea TaxID=104357 RepID=A0ABR3K1S2_9AGAR